MHWGTKETNEIIKSEQPDHKQGFEMKTTTENSETKTTAENSETKTTENLESSYRKAAREIYHEAGRIEIDEPNAEVLINVDVVEGYEPGCYVQAWVWVSTEEMEYLRDNAKAVSSSDEGGE